MLDPGSRDPGSLGARMAGGGARPQQETKASGLGVDADVLRHVVRWGGREHPQLAGLRAATAAHPLARMQISPDEGYLLGWLLPLLGARRTVEVGVFTGYSALATALALPADGTVVACDVSAEFAAVGRPFWEAAGVAGKIDLRIAPALETLRGLREGGGDGTYDFVFIDADKGNYGAYYEEAVELLRPGGVVAVDNVLWGGRVARPFEAGDADTPAIQALNERIYADPRVDACMLAVSDGLYLARKL